MPLLNYDILIHIVGQLSTYDALTMSTTCKSIHTIVMRETLSSVHLGSSKEIEGFSDFILADPSKRISLLRRISFDDETLSKQARRYIHPHAVDALLLLQKLASFLTEVLTQSHHLRAITLPVSGFMLMKFPALREAFTSNESLVELSLREPSQDVLQMLKNMRSSLRVLSLDYHGQESIENHPSDLSFLTKHREIKELVLLMGRRIGEWDRSKNIQWPSLRSLTILGSIPMDPFVSAFPNIRTLQTNWLNEGNAPEESTSQWLYLDHVVEPPDPDYRTWKIQCPIRWLEFLGPIHRDYDETGVFPKHAGTYEAIRCAAPAILSISVYYHINPEFWEPFSRISRDVKLLELTVYHSGDIPSTDDQWINKISEWLGNLKIPCLCLRFQQWVSITRKDWEFELRVAEKVRGIEDVLAASMTDLRFLAITTGPYAFKDVNVGLKEERSWWRISRQENNGGNGVAKSIPHGKGEQLRERLLGMDYKSLLSLHASDIELF